MWPHVVGHKLQTIQSHSVCPSVCLSHISLKHVQNVTDQNQTELICVGLLTMSINTSWSWLWIFWRDNVLHNIEISVFIARQHTDARYWYSNSVCPSVCLSVRDTLVLYENGLTYHHSFLPLYGSRIILVLLASNIFTKFRSPPAPGVLNTGGV